MVIESRSKKSLSALSLYRHRRFLSTSKRYCAMRTVVTAIWNAPPIPSLP
jgi:hypothetical protein